VTDEREKPVFLTGGTGFVGGHVLRELLARGYRVRCLVRGPSLGRLPDDPRAERAVGDLLSPRCYTRQLAGCQAAIHLVGIIAETPEATFRQIHIEGTQNLIVACQKGGVRRFVHLSALGAAPSPNIRYFQSKHQAETLVRSNGLDFTIFRPSLVHGPDGELVRILVRMVRSCLPLAVIGAGLQRLQPVYVDDLARLMADALERPQTVGQSYEVGGAQVVTYRELLDAIARAVRGRPRRKLRVPVFAAVLGAAVLEFVLKRPPFTREQLRMLLAGSVCESLEPLERDFGFRPRGFDETLALYAKELRNP
jgi:NADH dehydrogenase